MATGPRSSPPLASWREPSIPLRSYLERFVTLSALVAVNAATASPMAMPSLEHRSGRIETPMMEGKIGDALLAPGSDRDVEDSPDVPMPVSLVPANERIQKRIAKIGCAVVKSEPAACLKRPVEQWQCKSNESINIDIDRLPTHWNDGAKAYVAAEDFARCNPKATMVRAFKWPRCGLL